MFHYDKGLFLTQAGLAVDVSRRQPCGFISHAHTDHMARHELALCTPATARLYWQRMGRRPTVEIPYRQPIEWAGLRLETHPAGHVFGSAMLLADDGRQRLLYTGDFKLSSSATAEPAEPPHADILVMETTFGQPRYRLPPREEVVGQLLSLVRRALEAGRTPVVHAYVLGKAQEVTRILTDDGIAVLQHPLVHAVSQVYQECGCELGPISPWPGHPLPGHAVVAPPRNQKGTALDHLDGAVRIAVTGWAVDAGARYRLGVDYALPLSDHADFDELMQIVDIVAPQVVYCTHGPESFVDHLRGAGHRAFVLGRSRQLELF